MIDSGSMFPLSSRFWKPELKRICTCNHELHYTSHQVANAEYLRGSDSTCSDDVNLGRDVRRRAILVIDVLQEILHLGRAYLELLSVRILDAHSRHPVVRQQPETGPLLRVHVDMLEDGVGRMPVDIVRVREPVAGEREGLERPSG